LTPGLYGCQVWATFSLTYDSSKITPTYILQLGFLKRLLGVKKGTDTHCVLRETGPMPIFFYWFRCIIRFWNSLLSSNYPLLEKIVRADLATAVIHGLIRFRMRSRISLRLSNFLDAKCSRGSINLNSFELTVRKHITGGWRGLDNLTPT